MFLFANMQMVWLVIFIIFLIAELATSVSLVTIWFCFGAFGAIVAAHFGFSIGAQILIFLAISAVMLYLTRPLIKKFLRHDYVPTNADRILNTTCRVIEPINNKAGTGAIKFDGKIWTARSMESDVTYDEGCEVVVEKIQGVTAYIKSLKESE